MWMVWRRIFVNALHSIKDVTVKVGPIYCPAAELKTTNPRTPT